MYAEGKRKKPVGYNMTLLLCKEFQIVRWFGWFEMWYVKFRQVDDKLLSLLPGVW